MKRLMIGLALLGVITGRTLAADNYIGGDFAAGTTLQTVFGWNVVAGKTYKFKGLLLVNAHRTPGFNLRFTRSATVAHFTAHSDKWFQRLSSGDTARISPGYDEISVAFEGTIEVTGNGNFDLKVSCIDPSPATCTVKAGSIMTLEEAL